MFSCVRQSSNRWWKQRVRLQLMELEGVTLSNGVLFAKLRLLGGGRRFCQYSTRQEIRDNKVSWADQGPMEFAFRCHAACPNSDRAASSSDSQQATAAAVPPATASAQLRVSIRKEERGGRSYSKLGFAVVNLTALPLGPSEHSCILSPYSKGQRPDNSTLRLRLVRSAAAPAPTPSMTPAADNSAAATVEDAQSQTQRQHQLASKALVHLLLDAHQEASDPSAAGAAAVGAPGLDGADAAAAASELHRRIPSDFSFASSSARTHSRTNSLDQEIAVPGNSSLTFDFLSTSLERKRASLIPNRSELSTRIANTRADNFKLVREVLEQEGIRISGFDAAA